MSPGNIFAILVELKYHLIFVGSQNTRGSNFKSDKICIKLSTFGFGLACVAGGIRERASGRAAIFPPWRTPRGNSRAAQRVIFPPATFRMVFACPLLLLSMIQLNKPIRERSLN